MVLLNAARFNARLQLMVLLPGVSADNSTLSPAEFL